MRPAEFSLVSFEASGPANGTRAQAGPSQAQLITLMARGAPGSPASRLLHTAPPPPPPPPERNCKTFPPARLLIDSNGFIALPSQNTGTAPCTPSLMNKLCGPPASTDPRAGSGVWEAPATPPPPLPLLLPCWTRRSVGDPRPTASALPPVAWQPSLRTPKCGYTSGSRQRVWYTRTVASTPVLKTSGVEGTSPEHQL
ncbi:uncharacterized protein LOC126273274 [Schistocerca gregaria]|uniref:uncharacterized protein LOC126273274 n=1 Tax=Schistocerca gregaria TaxID=7010 RepID=UPI00211E5864|nr:uncharacterized protein LOC126273274 [Schistocerca gregaria]